MENPEGEESATKDLFLLELSKAEAALGEMLESSAHKLEIDPELESQIHLSQRNTKFQTPRTVKGNDDEGTVESQSLGSSRKLATGCSLDEDEGQKQNIAEMYNDDLMPYADMKPKFIKDFGLKFTKYMISGGETIYRGQIKIWDDTCLDMMPGLNLLNISA